MHVRDKQLWKNEEEKYKQKKQGSEAKEKQEKQKNEEGQKRMKVKNTEPYIFSLIYFLAEPLKFCTAFGGPCLNSQGEKACKTPSFCISLIRERHT